MIRFYIHASPKVAHYSYICIRGHEFPTKEEKMNKHDLASLLAKNNAGEQIAIQEYFQLLTFPGMPHELYTDIQEIISDEMNHSEKLSKWTTKISGVKPNVS